MKPEKMPFMDTCFKSIVDQETKLIIMNLDKLVPKKVAKELDSLPIEDFCKKIKKYPKLNKLLDSVTYAALNYYLHKRANSKR